MPIREAGFGLDQDSRNIEETEKGIKSSTGEKGTDKNMIQTWGKCFFKLGLKQSTIFLFTSASSSFFFFSKLNIANQRFLRKIPQLVTYLFPGYEFLGHVEVRNLPWQYISPTDFLETVAWNRKPQSTLFYPYERYQKETWILTQNLSVKVIRNNDKFRSV